MKPAIVLIALLLMTACSPVKENLEKNKILGHTVSVDSLPDEKRIMFRITADKTGFTPEKIEVKKNDYVRLIITNREDTDLSTFQIESYNIAEYYSYAESIEIPFVANKVGTFEFGDDSAYKRKGILIVSAEIP